MKKVLFLLLSLLLVSNLAYADQFKIVGARAMGMGGASVAVVGDNLANSEATTQYWNPAGLGLHQGFDIEIPVGVGMEATGGLLRHAKKISDAADQFDAIQEAQQNGTYITLDQIKYFVDSVSALEALNEPEIGVIGDINAGLNIAMGRWALSFNQLTSLGIDPNIDLANLFLGESPSVSNNRGVDLSEIPGIGSLTGTPSDGDLAAASTDLASTIDTLSSSAGVELGDYSSQEIANALVNYAEDQGTSEEEIIAAVGAITESGPILEAVLQYNGTVLSNNNSNVIVSGISLSELALGYGRDFGFLAEFLNNFYVGGNVKYLQGRVGYLKQRLWEEDVVTINTAYDDFNDNLEESSNFGIDVGLLYDITKFKTRIGLLARNINNPSFDQPSAAVADGLSDYDYNPQVRAGIAFKPTNWWLLAADIDLTSNRTPIESYKSRLFGFGTELNLFNKKSFNVALRGGMYRNLAMGNAPHTYTAGIGLNILHLIVEVTGAMSTQRVGVKDGSKIPSGGSLGMSVGFNF